MEERKWEIGEDLTTDDFLFDPITFGDVILAARCNNRKDAIDRDTMLNEFKAIVDMRTEDVSELFARNIDKMVALAKGE